MNTVIDVHPVEIWDNLRKEESSEGCKYVPLSEQLSQVSCISNELRFIVQNKST